MDKKVANNLLKICAFIAIVNLPFITITQLIGMNAFLDSFDFPESYQYFKSNKLDMDNTDENYLVLQKASHPDFSIIKGDEILYLKDEGGLICRRVYHVSKQEEIKKYYTLNFNEDINGEPIYDHQIIGKIVSVVDNNVWNTLSLKVWDISINNLNAVALFTNN
ncbi:MAG: hypothetical protein KAQ84_04820 [Thermoplasmatales archaeon]|nr:hypothetical protein [Thermoplasmatales archaeon]